MNSSLSAYRRAQKRAKRTAEVLSLHAPIHQEGLLLEEMVPGKDPLMRLLEDRLLFHDLAKQVTKQQMELVRLRSEGHSLREIARSQKLPMRQVQALLEEVRAILTKMQYE